MIGSKCGRTWVAFQSGRAAPPLSRRDWMTLAALGMLGYYGASIFDFIGLQYILKEAVVPIKTISETVN